MRRSTLLACLVLTSACGTDDAASTTTAVSGLASGATSRAAGAGSAAPRIRGSRNEASSGRMGLN